MVTVQMLPHIKPTDTRQMANRVLIVGIFATIMPLFLPNTTKAQTIRDYDHCIEMVHRAPAVAQKAAAIWRDQGGGYAARHCLALAMKESGQHRVAASRLESLARDMAADGLAEQASDIMAQAALLWTGAGEPDQSLSLLSDALVWTPDKPALLIDRAHARLAKNDPEPALSDLNRAIELGAEDADAYTLRAMIRRRAGENRDAYTDIARALALQPAHAGALLERARIRIALNDHAGARADLASVLQNHAEAPAAETARQILQKLETD